MELPKRKSPRIPGYHYAENNYYFITICTANKKCIFGRPSALNRFGKIAEECLLCIPGIYPHITIDHYVIMPNHIHIMFALENCQKEKTGVSIVRIIGQYKMAVTKKIHKIKPDMEVWQRSFHDHFIRNQSGYEKIWQYIENNPAKWEEDCFYCNDCET